MTTNPHLATGQHSLGPHVVGQRVVVRHLLPDGRATDVLGVCMEWGSRSITIERDGVGSVTIALADVVTGKPIPPRASARARVSARDAELHVASLWDGQESVPLGEWVLRSAAPYDGRLRRRANSVLAMGDPGVSFPVAAAAVRSFYADRHQPALAQVEVGSDSEAGLHDLGWASLGSGTAYFLLAPVALAVRSCNARLRALARRSDAAEEDPTARDKEEGNRVEVTIGDGRARGRAALDGDWLGLYDVVVDPAHRRRGLATAVLAELLDWGASQGALTAWLHVEVENAAALSLYEGLGFRTHHTLDYLTPPVD